MCVGGCVCRGHRIASDVSPCLLPCSKQGLLLSAGLQAFGNAAFSLILQQ